MLRASKASDGPRLRVGHGDTKQIDRVTQALARLPDKSDLLRIIHHILKRQSLNASLAREQLRRRSTDVFVGEPKKKMVEQNAIQEEPNI